MAETECPCDAPQSAILTIPAGLSALPRQTQTFPDVRRALLAEVARKNALSGWRARGERDFGLMWLEMWAYVADVLGFYDERIANESYLRTAVRRPSLRRIVDLLGYIPAPGTAGSATVAAIAEGRTSILIAESTAVRSDAFAGQSPQVFESKQASPAHLLANSWEIGPLESTQLGGTELRTELIFETANFGLARDRLVAIRRLDGGFANAPPQVATVRSTKSFEGRDGRTYIRVTLDRKVRLPPELRPSDIQVQIPTVSAVATRLQLAAPTKPVLVDPDVELTTVLLDSIYRQLKRDDRIIVVHPSFRDDLDPETAATLITPAFFQAREIEEVADVTISVGSATIPVTQIDIDEDFTEDDPSSYVFHFAFVDAGRVTQVADTEPPASRLTAPGGVPIVGIVERPPTVDENGVLEQTFLLRDADNQGARVEGTMRFKDDGTATFEVDSGTLPPTLKTPITVYGNILETTRGESVRNEILGSGDARSIHQQFKLKKKPLTYLFDASVPVTKARSTLEVRVNDVLWKEVRSFFGQGPESQVYIVRHDDAGNTFVTFGDGVRGARVPSGVKNVRASYRFGGGFAAPPAGSIRQLARAVKGLRRVESPIAAVNGKDPDPPEALRTLAPKSVLLFQRAVSALDFEVLASQVSGVEQVSAEFLWIETEQQAGVLVTYIGTPEPDDVLAALLPEAEPGLPLAARKAVARGATLTVDVEVHPDFDKDLVAENVEKALIHPETGPLIRKNAPIGQRLFRSAIFDVIHDVEGVIGINTARMTRAGSSTIDFKNSSSSSVCAGAGKYFEFNGEAGVTVTGHSATAPVPGAGRQEQGAI